MSTDFGKCYCGAALTEAGPTMECRPCRAGRLAAAGIRLKPEPVEDLGEIAVDRRLPTRRKLREVLRAAKLGGYADDQCVAIPLRQLRELLDELDAAAPLSQPKGETP